MDNISSKTTRVVGNTFETLAENHLQSSGLTTITRNFSSKSGEIDLIMLDNQTIVFIEVRFRNSSHFGSAIDSITPTKQKKIIRTAKFFLLQNKKYHTFNCRFDVVGIDQNNNNPLQITWIKNAFIE